MGSKDPGRGPGLRAKPQALGSYGHEAPELPLLLSASPY